MSVIWCRVRAHGSKFGQDHWAFNFNYRIDPSVDIVTLDELRDPSTLKTHTEQ